MMSYFLIVIGTNIMESVKRALNRAIDNLRGNEQKIIANNVSERTITHKLAEYLQQEFPSYNVDCEYNRNFEEGENKPKSITLLRDSAVKFQKAISKEISNSSSSNETQALLERSRTIITYPDIIVHKRLSNESNKLIVEVKKSNCNNKGALVEFDKSKLKAFTSDLNGYSFDYGVFLMINISNDWQEPEQIWFRNGVEIRLGSSKHAT